MNNFNLNSVGETVNLMAIDTQRMMDVTSQINTIWTSPMAIILSFYFLWGYLGPSSLAGLVIMVLLIPVNAVLSNRMKKYQRENMKNKDTRIKVQQIIFLNERLCDLAFYVPVSKFCLMHLQSACIFFKCPFVTIIYSSRTVGRSENPGLPVVIRWA